MSEQGSDQPRRTMRGFLGQHLDQYLSSGGTAGHIVDTTLVGNPRFSPTLVLRTRGRVSGKPYLAPLTYGLFGPEWVVIASKGGAPDHPAWYLNLCSRPDCEMQIATQVFRCGWREAQGEERQRIWAYMAALYPPYVGYEKSAGDRIIPVIMLSPIEEVGVSQE